MPTVEEFKGLGIVVEQMSKRVEQLRAEQKTREAAIKELNSQVVLVEMECQEKIRVAKASCEAEMAALEKAVQPLRALKQDCEKVRKELVELSQEKLNAIAEAKAARTTAIREVDQLVAAKSAKLAAIEASIATCKAKVASL